jgi:hypothetical protein
LGIEYYVSIDPATGNDYSCRVTIKHNIRTGISTISKIEYGKEINNG